MDFTVPHSILRDVEVFKVFLREHVIPRLASWHQERSLPRSLFAALGKEGWFGFTWEEGRLSKRPTLRTALLGEQLARISPGVAVAALAHNDLGISGLWLFGSDRLQREMGKEAVAGDLLLCLGNTESGAGSDVAGISMRADKVQGGWVLNGAKAYVTNGALSDGLLATAVSDPEAPRSRRLSMFLVDLDSRGVSRTRLNKQVWIPSDLTRIQLSDVFVPDDHLVGERGRGLHQVLTIFTHSRVCISALTLGTAEGAFDMALEHARKRRIFGQRIVDQQAKAFELADLYAKMEAARLLVLRACCAADREEPFRLDASLAKYMAVQTAREVTQWAADIFGAASVVYEHPVHKFPLDVWAASLGEGTQDVQKLVIFREVMKREIGAAQMPSGGAGTR
ncbi:MAG: acyl-CoA dehydrogenase family protein [Thermodesulfobacteriota bacterium]